MNLTGNTILITGGTSGIGLAFAVAFLEKNNKVIICGRREDRLTDLKTKYPSLITRICDVSDVRERKKLQSWILQNHPDTNILMNNAGIQLAIDFTKSVDLTRVNTEIETNLVAPIHLCGLFTPHLSRFRESAIINITSGLAFVPIAFMPVYCATKAALHSFSISLRYQLRNSNVKVFEVAPPSVDTELGHERRTDKTQTHGGIPVGEFLSEALEALESDLYEAPIGMSKHLRAQGAEMFEKMNSQL